MKELLLGLGIIGGAVLFTLFVPWFVEWLGKTTPTKRGILLGGIILLASYGIGWIALHG